MKRKIIIVIGIFILVFLTGTALIYHRLFDYDIASILKNPTTAIQKVQDVAAISHIQHVFIIVEENHDFDQIYKSKEAPFINNTLLVNGSYATNYHNVDPSINELHPSEPNYIILESGGISFNDYTFQTDADPSDNNSTNTHNHLSYLLSQYGYTWKSYQEDISGNDCPINSFGNYAAKHNPFVYFQDVTGNPPSKNSLYCKLHIRPFNELTSDLQNGSVANYNFITPNLMHDMHNGTIKEADDWLSQIVPQIINSDTFKKDGVLFITWDEGRKGEKNNPIGMIVLSPFIKTPRAVDSTFTHASIVKTIEEIFHLSPLLGLAGDKKTNDLSEFFN